MPYITIPVKQAGYQLSIDDIIYGIDEATFQAQLNKKDMNDTRTAYRRSTPGRLLEQIHFDEMVDALKAFNQKYETLIAMEDKTPLYRSFKIPKRSGGLRPIDAPKDELSIALYELKSILEHKMFASHHTCAFAYVSRRCAIDAVKRHQANRSRWFLKLDFHNFFGSTTLEFVESQLKMIFPFNELYLRADGAEELHKALSLCFLRGGLPQGTPISPMLTNLFMIPIDHAIAKIARGNTPYLVYTRYADDILISSDISFKWREVQDTILGIIDAFKAPFTLNTAKTRYGSSAGRNWNLGVMLNKDNKITIGHAKKKLFKVKVYSFMRDFAENNPWSIGDTQSLSGEIAYYRMVEKDEVDKIIKFYSEKFNRDVMATIKSILTAA